MIINRKEIQQLIPTAIKAIETVGIANTEGEVSKVNEGYINAMGPSIIQSGLLPTLIFYNKSKKEGNNTEGEPCLWLRALYYMHYMHLPEEEREGINWRELAPTTLIKKIIAGQGGNLEQISRRDDLKDWEGKILKYIVALKLALRTFEIKEDKENKKEGGNE